MPKVRELGVTVVPEGFGPVEIGQGAGCGCTNVTNPCLLCTQNVTRCGALTQWACARVSTCTDCTTQPYSICGTTPGSTARFGCTDCTTQAYSICGTTPGQCTDCTTQAYSICGTTPGIGQCTDCTTQAFSICGTTPGQCTDCTTQAFSICGTSPGAQKCTDCTNIPFSICGTTPGPGTQTSTLTQDHIKQLRAALNAQLAALDEHEKALLPKSEEEIDAREKEINAELERLRTRRDELKKG